MLVMIGGARFAGVDHQLDNGVLARAGYAGHGSNRASFAQKMEDAGAVGGGKLFHTDYHA